MKKELGDLTGLNVLVIGRSHLVGRPLAKMLTDEDCTVTLAHSKTKNLFEYMKSSDVVVSAVGKPKEFDLGWCWNADMVVDVGINRDQDNHLCGDFGGFDETEMYWLKVTPVPKGVGLMTRAMLMKNIAEASERKGF
jgi:methylenetetrahydrofolate dehydrogenase (NADP+)/methenyltetrahydrofolate cyclohydrolase